MNEALRKKYIPMTETTYYTLLSVTVPRHGYAIIQFVNRLTGGRIILGTGTLYTMVGRLLADGVVTAFSREGKKVYRITDAGLALLQAETGRLAIQLEEGWSVLNGCMSERDGDAAGCGQETYADRIGTAGISGGGLSHEGVSGNRNFGDRDPGSIFPDTDGESVMAIRGGT